MLILWNCCGHAVSGVEQIALWAMQQVRLIPLLQQLGCNGPQRAAAVGSIIGRMAAPGSERATYRWLQQRSALGELLEVDYESMSMMQLYRASDLLGAAQKEIESHLFNRVTDLFGLEVTVTLYAMTPQNLVFLRGFQAAACCSWSIVTVRYWRIAVTAARPFSVSR